MSSYLVRSIAGENVFGPCQGPANVQELKANLSVAHPMIAATSVPKLLHGFEELGDAETICSDASHEAALLTVVWVKDVSTTEGSLQGKRMSFSQVHAKRIFLKSRLDDARQDAALLEDEASFCGISLNTLEDSSNCDMVKRTDLLKDVGKIQEKICQLQHQLELLLAQEDCIADALVYLENELDSLRP